MRLLAWDTSSKVGCLAAMEWGDDGAFLKKKDSESKSSSISKIQSTQEPKLVSEWTLNVSRFQHSESLLWAIHQILEASRWKLNEVDYFGVGLGPGSFTGLRIGVTTARTLAHVLKKPLVGVSSLSVLARPAAIHFAELDKRVLVGVLRDACKGEVFALFGSAKAVLECCIYPNDGGGDLWKRGVIEEAITPYEFVNKFQKKLKEGKHESYWSLLGDAHGDGFSIFDEILKELPVKNELRFNQEFSGNMQGRHLGRIVWEAIQAGKEKDALNVYPRYARLSDAEVKLKSGKLKPPITRGL